MVDKVTRTDLGHPDPRFEGPAETGIERAQKVLMFWTKVGPDGWFARNDQTDRLFRDQFIDLHFAAARGQCMHWLDDAQAGLALILLLDQFPRNVFRDTAHMFATDPLARTVADRFIERGHMDNLDVALRLFVCLPFSHSESMHDQDRAIALHETYIQGDMYWPRHHRQIIKQFGRFPHRNASLGRHTTPEEQEFMEQGGFQG